MPSGKNALTTADLVIVGLEAATKQVATRMLAERMVIAGRVTDIDGYLEDVRLREEQMNTGLPGGIGIPHARSAHVTRPTVAIGISVKGVDFGAHDGPAHLIFLIGAPDGSDDAHLQILAALARKLVHEDFRETLRNAESAAAIASIIQKDIKP
jgi:PTS system fructose-specific IIA component